MKKNYLQPELTDCEMEFRNGLMVVSALTVDAITQENMAPVDLGSPSVLDF